MNSHHHHSQPRPKQNRHSPPSPSPSPLPRLAFVTPVWNPVPSSSTRTSTSITPLSRSQSRERQPSTIMSSASHQQTQTQHDRQRKRGTRIETMVHARQVGHSAVDDMQLFLKTEPREKRVEVSKNKLNPKLHSSSSRTASTGSGKPRAGRRNGIERADCFVEPAGHEVIISPGFF